MYIVIKLYKRTRAFNCIRVCARGPVLLTIDYTGQKLDISTILKFLRKPLTTAVAVYYTGLTVKRGIKRHEVTNNEKQLFQTKH